MKKTLVNDSHKNEFDAFVGPSTIDAKVEITKSEADRRTATEQRLARFGCGCGCPTCRLAHSGFTAWDAARREIGINSKPVERSTRRADGRFTDCRGRVWEDPPF